MKVSNSCVPPDVSTLHPIPVKFRNSMQDGRWMAKLGDPVQLNLYRPAISRTTHDYVIFMHAAMFPGKMMGSIQCSKNTRMNGGPAPLTYARRDFPPFSA